MWIWYVSRTDGGSVPAIAADARHLGLRTLLIKSGDGGSYWSQFSHALVSRLHASGLRACAWQYVYGNDPAAEARVGAAAVRHGADCLMIDAEGEYEGKYVQAQTYIRTLRGLIGTRFPVALAGLPYIDYHPAFPYSVFLGPGGAQYNAPQMYWTAIGTSVDHVYAHTYEFNRIYARTVFPLGDITSGAPTSQIMRFRQLSKVYGAPSISWWDWQEASASALRAISAPLVPTAASATVPPRASLGPRGAGRPRRLGPGAPRPRRGASERRRGIRSGDAVGRPPLPGRPRAEPHRRHQRGDLAHPPALHPGPRALGERSRRRRLGARSGSVADAARAALRAPARPRRGAPGSARPRVTRLQPSHVQA